MIIRINYDRFVRDREDIVRKIDRRIFNALDLPTEEHVSFVCRGRSTDHDRGCTGIITIVHRRIEAVRARVIFNLYQTREAPLCDQVDVRCHLAVCICFSCYDIEPADQYPVLTTYTALKRNTLQHLFKINVEIADLSANEFAIVRVEVDMILQFRPLGIHGYICVEHGSVEIKLRAERRVCEPALELITHRSVGRYIRGVTGKVCLIIDVLCFNILIIRMELQRPDITRVINVSAVVFINVVVTDRCCRRCIACTIDIISIRIVLVDSKPEIFIIQPIDLVSIQFFLMKSNRIVTAGVLTKESYVLSVTLVITPSGI